MPRLTFNEGKFVFDKGGNGPSGTFDLKSAIPYRQFADDSAEKVFKRSLAISYDNLPILPELHFLDPHQKEGIQWILKRSRSYLAHAPGAGKTCQAVVASSFTTQPGQVLFIVPPTLSINWSREIFRFTEKLTYFPTVSTVPSSSQQKSMDWKADFIICPDSMLTKDWVYTKLLHTKWKFIAVDEASRFKEFSSQRSKAFYGGKHGEKIYPGLFQWTPHVVFLDGSPMPNRPMELWAPVFALDPHAIDYMGYFDFGNRYCGPTYNKFNKEIEFKGSSNEEELKAKLQKDFMHVVTEDKLKHPERLRSILLMNKDVRAPDMKDWERKNIGKIKLSDISESSDTGGLANYRLRLGVRKVPWVSSYVADRLKEKSESILLFAWHREVCENLALELKAFKPSVIYGGTSNEKREKAFALFQRGETRLLIGNIQSVGRGHNLQKANRIIFAEYSWTDELNKQCEARSARKGNTRANIRCEYICVPNSIDEIVLQTVFNKAQRVKKVIG